MHQLEIEANREAARQRAAQAYARGYGMGEGHPAASPARDVGAASPRASALVENMGVQIDRIVAALMRAELGLDRLNGPQPMADVPGVATAPCISSLDRLAEKISHLAIIADSAEHLATRIDNIA